MPNESELSSLARRGGRFNGVFKFWNRDKKSEERGLVTWVRGVPLASEKLNVGNEKLEKQTGSGSQAMSNSPIMSAPITGADK